MLVWLNSPTLRYLEDKTDVIQWPVLKPTFEASNGLVSSISIMTSRQGGVDIKEAARQFHNLRCLRKYSDESTSSSSLTATEWMVEFPPGWDYWMERSTLQYRKQPNKSSLFPKYDKILDIFRGLYGPFFFFFFCLRQLAQCLYTASAQKRIMAIHVFL